jgi:hypothetical protein
LRLERRTALLAEGPARIIRGVTDGTQNFAGLIWIHKGFNENAARVATAPEKVSKYRVTFRTLKKVNGI